MTVKLSIALFVLSFIIKIRSEQQLEENAENLGINCERFCKEWKEISKGDEENHLCNCRIEREGSDFDAPSTNTTTFPDHLDPQVTLHKRSIADSPKHRSEADPTVGQSQGVGTRRIHHRPRARHHLRPIPVHHSPSARAHLVNPQALHRLHEARARARLHHRPHLVGSVMERFGGGKGQETEQKGPKKLRVRQKETREEVKVGERSKGEKKEEMGLGKVQIVTQSPDLVDG